MNAPELDPVAIRHSLQQSRQQGLPFDQAWVQATGHHPIADGDARRMITFMATHFRAAYYNDATSKGRYSLPAQDVSNALSGTRTAAFVLDGERCRSGDGCDREATDGRFGRMWCEYHHAELSRLAVKLADARSKADPRNNGNRSLFTHRAA